VRINITSEPDPDRPLRMGATAKVRIDTTEGGQ
jgi:multidrug resistance efflux pump